MNFSPGTYPKEREFVYSHFAKFSWCKKSNPKNLGSYLTDMIAAKFTLSPRGNGIDCHRTWEALLMGAIPIVRSSSLDPLYKDLPVLIIDDWEDVTENFLQEEYNLIKNKTFRMEKIYLQYWIAEIRRVAQLKGKHL